MIPGRLWGRILLITKHGLRLRLRPYLEDLRLPCLPSLTPVLFIVVEAEGGVRGVK